MGKSGLVIVKRLQWFINSAMLKHTGYNEVPYIVLAMALAQLRYRTYRTYQKTLSVDEASYQDWIASSVSRARYWLEGADGY